MVMRGTDGRLTPHGRPLGVFFSGDPQTDTLMPKSLLNGFALEGQPGRVGAEEFFPFLEMTVKSFAGPHPTGKSTHTTVGERFMEVITGALSGGARLDQAVMEHRQEVKTFERNQVEYPYNLLRDFEESPPPASVQGSRGAGGLQAEEPPQLMRHTGEGGNLVAFRLATLSALEQTVLEWSRGTLMQELARKLAPAALPNFLVLQLGKYRPGSVSGTVVVFLQLALDRVTLIDKYINERNAPTLTLLHLGPTTVPVVKDDFFDDMSELEDAIAERRILGTPIIKRFRFWQSRADSHHKGAVVAFQAMYSDSMNADTKFRTPIRGSRANAQFFVDIALGDGEIILGVSCFYVAGVYGSISFRTNAGVYTVGNRETGLHHSIDIPRQELYDAIAFLGETGREGSLTCLKVVAIQPHHFGTICGPKLPACDFHVEVGSRSNDNNAAPSKSAAAEVSTAASTDSLQKHESRGSYRPQSDTPSRHRVRPSSALAERGGLSIVSDAKSVAPVPRPQSAMARHSGNRDANSAGGVSKDVPNELLGANKRDVSREQHSDVPARESGPRLRVRASDRRVDALLKADEVQDDWKQSVRNAISQGIITAQTRLVLQVEYCTAERPSETLRGSKEQYSKIATDLKEKVCSNLWEYNVVVLDNKNFEQWAEGNHCISTPISKPRIGSCEIILSWQHRSSPKSIVIHSKLQSRKWPITDIIVTELRSCLPTQYHDIRFFAQSSSQNASANGARFTVFMKEGEDPLCLIGEKATVLSDADGMAHISLPVGSYDVNVEHENFLPHSFQYRIGRPEGNEYRPFVRVVLHPKCSTDQIKVNLVWNESPSDLDLYAVTPFTKVWHDQPVCENTRCHLGQDARRGYGPESITFERLSREQHGRHLHEGRTSNLRIYVHNYSEECDLSESGAVLTIMGEKGIIHEIEVPTVGTGEFWDVCSIDMRHLQVQEVNRLMPSEPAFDILVETDETADDRMVASNCTKFGSASTYIKEHLDLDRKDNAPLRTSVALLHDFHNYNGVR